jgi:hypothetical protein
MGANYREADGRSLERRYELINQVLLVNTQEVFLGVILTDGFFDNFLVSQVTAGGAGTSISFALKRRRGAAVVDLLSTAAILTLAAGAGATVETNKGRTAIATPGGCTKPVFDATKKALKRGDLIYVVPTQTGAYGPFPIAACSMTYQPSF